MPLEVLQSKDPRQGDPAAPRRFAQERAGRDAVRAARVHVAENPRLSRPPALHTASRARARSFCCSASSRAGPACSRGVAAGAADRTHLFYPAQAWLPRYDFLTLSAVAIQILMLRFRLETWDEAKVILAFHVAGTVMDIFQDRGGRVDLSRAEFPPHRRRAAVFGLHVRLGRLLHRPDLADFEIRVSHYPPAWAPPLLALGIYLNFFTHPLAVGRALCAAGGDDPGLRADDLLVPAVSPLPADADPARLLPGRTLHLVRREYRHVVAGLGIYPTSATAGTWCRPPKLVAWYLSDDHLVRAGQPGQPAAADGRSARGRLDCRSRRARKMFRFIIGIALLRSRWQRRPGASPIRPRPGPICGGGDESRITFTKARFSFPTRAGAVALEGAYEFGHPGEGLDSGLQYESPTVRSSLRSTSTRRASPTTGVDRLRDRQCNPGPIGDGFAHAQLAHRRRRRP